MAFVGGDLLEISYKHSVVGSGTLFPKAGEDMTVDKGGYVTADAADDVTGDGQAINKLTRKRWSCETTVAWDSVIADELDQMQKMAGSPIDADWTFTHINGTIWGGKGRPVGDIQGSTKDAQMKIKVSGGGTLDKIS